MYKVVFMGTPDFAVPPLAALHESSLCTVVGVYTNPDRPKNRGMKLTASPVKEYALAHDIPVFQPQSLRTGEAEESLRALDPDLVVVAAYGKILPESVLNVPTRGCVNLHASLLPAYRGAAPAQRAILNGDRETGVTLMQMARGLDTGDMIDVVRTPIEDTDTSEILLARLSNLAADLLIQNLSALLEGRVTRTLQREEDATLAPMLDRSLSPIDWAKPARMISCQVRALIPWPCATAEFGGARFRIHRVEEGPPAPDCTPGTLLGVDKKGLRVVCGEGESLYITELQADGGRRMPAADYFRGHPLPEEGR